MMMGGNIAIIDLDDWTHVSLAVPVTLILMRDEDDDDEIIEL